jgi:hypothetical protein
VRSTAQGTARCAEHPQLCIRIGTG